ncbi:MAG: hypothetical protein U0228_25905 [Myxococcaceae bacterium]
MRGSPFHHAQWSALTDPERRVAVDQVLEVLGPEWTFEQTARVADWPVAFFVHAPSDVRFVLVPGGRFIEGWTEEDDARLAQALARDTGDWHGAGDPRPISFPPQERVVRPFLLAVWPLAGWSLEGLLGHRAWLELSPQASVRAGAMPEVQAALARRRWRLPTSTEWEFAARAGTRSLFPDGTDDVPRFPAFAANPLGLMRCGEGEEVCDGADGYAVHGGSANSFPWQGPNWIESLTAWRSSRLPDSFCAIRPAVSLALPFAEEETTHWLRARGTRGRFVPAPVTLPPGLDPRLVDQPIDDFELDLRTLINAAPDVARAFTRRLFDVRYFPDSNEVVHALLDFVESPRVSARGRLAAWLFEGLGYQDWAPDVRERLRELLRDADPAVRGAARWWHGGRVDAGEHLVVRLCAAMRRDADEAREALQNDPELIVAATAGKDPAWAITALKPPADFPFPARTWFAELLLRVPRGDLVPAVLARAERKCVDVDDFDVRDLAAAKALEVGIGWARKGPLEEWQRQLIARVRASGAHVRWESPLLPRGEQGEE